jgi:hypothetical protein
MSHVVVFSAVPCIPCCQFFFYFNATYTLEKTIKHYNSSDNAAIYKFLSRCFRKYYKTFPLWRVMNIYRHLTTQSTSNNTEDWTTWRVMNIYRHLTTRSARNNTEDWTTWRVMNIYRHLFITLLFVQSSVLLLVLCVVRCL